MCIGSDECDCDFEEDDFDEECDDGDDDLRNNIDGVGFADPGGVSSLRAATIDNPRIFPCPTCGVEDRLTAIDVAHSYQCNQCAEASERGY